MSAHAAVRGAGPVAVRPVALADTRVLRQRVLRPAETVEQQAEHEPPDAFAAGAFAGGELVAVGLIGREGTPGSWRVRGMATAPEHRARGYGTAVLAALLAHAQAAGAARVWCTARLPARSLYERAGFVVCSEVYEPPGIGPHVKMERRLR
jgi:GNAT superfamily N-acetyltransferase